MFCTEYPGSFCCYSWSGHYKLQQKSLFRPLAGPWCRCREETTMPSAKFTAATGSPWKSPSLWLTPQIPKPRQGWTNFLHQTERQVLERIMRINTLNVSFNRQSNSNPYIELSMSNEYLLCISVVYLRLNCKGMNLALTELGLKAVLALSCFIKQATVCFCLLRHQLFSILIT